MGLEIASGINLGAAACFIVVSVIMGWALMRDLQIHHKARAALMAEFRGEYLKLTSQLRATGVTASHALKRYNVVTASDGLFEIDALNSYTDNGFVWFEDQHEGDVAFFRAEDVRYVVVGVDVLDDQGQLKKNSEAAA
jgi:hypothetical protein